jgi:hypothetical protein
MDPLRYGAGEAGTFHPLSEALQNNTSKNGFRQRFLVWGVRPEGISATRVCSPWSGHSTPKIIRKRWGLNSLFGQGSLRIPLRLVL